MRRKTPMTLGTLAPWWLLFAALITAVALHQKTFDVAVGIAPAAEPGVVQPSDAR